MSLEHSPARARRDAARMSLHDDDNAVLTVRQWASLNNFSIRTASRILRGPKAKRPVITQLSEHRIGVTRGNNRRWQEARAR